MTLDVTTLARGDGSRFVEPRRAIVRDSAAWQALWAAHAGPQAPVPAVDFTHTIVAAAFAGERPTPGFQIEISRGADAGGIATLVVEERRPPADMIAAQVIVTPYHIVTIPRQGGDVRFADPVGPAPTDDPFVASGLTRKNASRREVDAPSSTGLDPKTAGALAYLAGPFSGVIILLAEDTSPYVKFHAWQAIIGVGGLGALASLLLMSAFAALIVSPLLFTLMYRLAALTALVCVVALVACVIAAAQGREWKLPVAGALAARKAARLA